MHLLEGSQIWPRSVVPMVEHSPLLAGYLSFWPTGFRSFNWEFVVGWIARNADLLMAIGSYGFLLCISRSFHRSDDAAPDHCLHLTEDWEEPNEAAKTKKRGTGDAG